MACQVLPTVFASTVCIHMDVSTGLLNFAAAGWKLICYQDSEPVFPVAACVASPPGVWWLHLGSWPLPHLPTQLRRMQIDYAHIKALFVPIKAPLLDSRSGLAALCQRLVRLSHADDELFEFQVD